MAYRLGLDVGTNSIGWAALHLDADGNSSNVLDLGVRVFSDGRNPQDGTSLAAQRRLPRGQRRRRDRYLKRRGDLLDALTSCGLMPPDEDARRGVAALDPYQLRARALDQRLAPFELGRALFHLNQRRGFKSNRKAAGEDENAAKKIRADMDALRKAIDESGARTLGEFLARRRANKRLVRARPGMGLYPDRSLYEAEFDAIRQAQEPHHCLRADQWDSLKDVIFHQRPLKPVEPGWCSLEEGQRRAARALPVAQESRMLQEVNNLKLRLDVEPERPLTDDERERAMHKLRDGKNIDLKKPTLDLGLPSGAAFNLSRGGRTSVKGDEATARLVAKRERGQPAKELFGDRWLALPLDERNAIVTFILDEDPQVVRRQARTAWGLNDAQAQAVSEVSLPSGHANLSEKAIRKLLPHLRNGLVYSDAVIAAGYPHHSDFRNAEAHARLPYYGEVLERDVVGADPTKDPETDGEPARFGRFPNPTVHIGLNQIRRVVNKLIETYGTPEEIVIELARDLKSNKEQRDYYRRQQQEGKKRNERFEEMLQSAGGSNTPEMRRKLRLWEEQGLPQARVCPYTGTPLSFGMVVNSQTEIDHILPFSRTLNDSMANKVVCTAEANRYKGDRSPFEAFGHSPPGYDYAAIQGRAAALPDNKRWRFDPDAMEKSEQNRDFLDRQLNETRYLSRTARRYLAHLYDEKTESKERVRVIPGHMTALLRRGWGLEGMLRVDQHGEIRGKQRDDHRHHAIDAFVVANTTQGLLQQFARAASSSHETEERLAAVAARALPWNGFTREELTPHLERLVVSHKPDHGTPGQQGTTTGRLHKDTAYKLVTLSEDGPSTVVVRKPLSTIKKATGLNAVRDPSLREALEELWRQVEMEGGKPADFAQRAASDGVLVNGRRQRVRRVRVLDKQRVIPIRNRDERPYKGYLPGGNEFADVWRMRDGSWRLVVIPTFDANQPGFDPSHYRPVTSKGKHKGKPDPAAKRLTRLHINDIGALGEGAKRRIVRVRKMSASGTRTLVWLDDHNEADVAARVSRKEMADSKFSARQLNLQGFRKIGVDEIGRVIDPGPRS